MSVEQVSSRMAADLLSRSSHIWSLPAWIYPVKLAEWVSLTSPFGLACKNKMVVLLRHRLATKLNEPFWLVILFPHQTCWLVRTVVQCCIQVPEVVAKSSRTSGTQHYTETELRSRIIFQFQTLCQQAAPFYWCPQCLRWLIGTLILVDFLFLLTLRSSHPPKDLCKPTLMSDEQ